jgi:small subunit ribosomal protein S2
MPQSQAELVKNLVDAGVHFGHRVSRWNPKMQPYIHGKRNMIHIIDVKETMKGLLLAKRLISRAVARQGRSLRRHQAPGAPCRRRRSQALRHALRRERWLGGTLTNFRTIRARLNRLDELEKLWETGQIETYSKKMKATLQREMEKIKANLEGIRKMERMPGVMFIIDTRREHIAVKEAKKLGVTTVALIDTDSDPDLIDLPIPGNDDAMRAIEVIVKELADAVIDGKSRPRRMKGEEAQQPRKRSSRAAFRAEDPEVPRPARDAPVEAPAW